jgi:diguanylate cyclase (GGDEF)-like protein
LLRSLPTGVAWGPRRIWRDPALIAAVAWTLLGTVIFVLAAGHTATQLRVFWAFQTPLDALLLVCSWRVAQIATGQVRLFWLTLTGAAALFLLGDTEQTVLTLLDPAHLSTTGAAVQTTCLAVGLGSVVVSMLRYQPPGGAGREGTSFWLDAATVLVAGAVLAWCFVIAPMGLNGAEIAGTLTVAGVALTAAFAAVKLILTGNAPMNRLAAAPMIGSAVAMSVGAFLAPSGPVGVLSPAVYAVRLLPSLLICAGPRIQELIARFDIAPFGGRRRQPYSLAPYGSIVIVFGLLIFSLPGGVNARLWGVVVGLTVITALVAARQLVAFHDNEKLIGRLDQTLDELRLHEARLLDQALFDGLTKLANRTHFTEQIATALKRSARPGEVWLLLIDLDDFKTVNDTRGHATGDALLIHVAERLRGAVRPDDLVGRLGGDEFAVLLRGCTEPEAGRTAQRMLDSLAQPIRIQQTDLLVRASIGVADAGARPDVQSLMREADIAMYESKARGKGAWTRYVPEMGVRIRRGADLTAQLGRALDAGRFHLEYQPIVRLGTGELTGCEALLRWNAGPRRKALSPAEFIPVAEESGLIVPIGHWVLGEACRQAAEWRLGYPAAATLVVNVNVAGRQLRQPGFAATVADALREHDLPARCLSIEVTETAVLDDESAIATMHALRDLGVGLALDDFGTAASSLGLLLTCPVTTLKLDRSFVEGVITVDRQAAVAMAVSQIADALSLTSVAEGVETPEQAKVLQELGYHNAQGFLYSRPLPPAALAALLERPHALGRNEITTG